MTGRELGVQLLRTVTFGLMLVALSSCGGGGTTSDAPAFVDSHPLPEEPMVVSAEAIGTYGGRFVIAQTSGPRTFNDMMANETSSTDITSRMFMGLDRL